MQPKTRRIIVSAISILLALLIIIPLILETFILMSGAASSVSDLNKRLETLDKEKAQLQAELNRVRSKKSTASEKKEAIDKKLSVTAKEIATIDQLIAQLDADSAMYQTELEEAQEKETDTYELFKKRIRAMEENGTVSYLTVILSADSFSAMLSRAEIIGNIMSYDRGIMNDLKEQQALITTKQEQIKESKAAQESARAKLSAKKAELSEQENEAAALLKELTSEERAYKRAFDEAEAAQKAAKEEIKRLTSGGSSSGSKYVGGDLMWPVPGKYTITSYYGTRKDPITKVQSKHTGIDIAASSGTKIVAANSGTVIVAGWSSRGYGNYVVIDHGGGRSTLYAHQSRLGCKKGDYVTKGQTIGYVGSTGYSTGPHLHFEVLINGDDVNPMNYFKKG